MTDVAICAFSHPEQAEKPYRDPTPLPADARVPELGTTSAPLKSAAFFIGAYCKDYNGACSDLKPVFCMLQSVPGFLKSCGDEGC